MAGIYGFFLKNKPTNQIYRHFYNAGLDQTKGEEISHASYLLGRSVINKFEKDRFLFENDSFIICYEGLNHSTIRSSNDFIQAYQQKGKDFVKELKGNFSGFLYDKIQNKVLVFTDPLATKQIYYYFDKEQGFAFASEMHVLTKILRTSQISLQINKDGIYCLALYGQLFDGMTTVEGIHKLNYGSTVEVDLRESHIKETAYYRFTKQIQKQSVSEVIERFDHHMLQAIQEEWQKDRDYGYQSICLISGGLDSRVNTLIAKELGFTNFHSYTYGNPHSTDLKIAQKIANDHFYSHIQRNFTNGAHLRTNVLEDYIKGTEGRIIFAALAMVFNAIKHINPQAHGILHAGQIGDVVSGIFVKPGFNFKENRDKIGLTAFSKNPQLLDKIDFLDDFLAKYEGSDYEVFAYEQGIVNGTLHGDHIANNFIDLVSPFYHKDLVDYCLTIPNEYKLNQWIYTKWLREKHPELTKYTWERIGLKPNSDFNVKYGRLIRKYVNGGKKYFGLKYDSMNPITTWFQQDPKIMQTFDQLFEENIHLIEDHEIQADLRKIYQDDIFEYRNKFSVLSAVLGIKLHLHE